MIDSDGVAAQFALGRARNEATQVHGGLLNRLWRLDTDRGSFAVKELNLDRGWALRLDDVLRLELAAFETGVPMPEPVPDPSTGGAMAVVAGASVIVHRWVDGRPVQPGPVDAGFAHAVGALLARLHTLEVTWTHVSIEDPMPTESAWGALAERALAAGQPWAEALAAAVPDLGEIGRRVDAAGRPEPIVLTHRDVNQKNLLDAAGRPVLLDWETSGLSSLAGELGQTALSLSRGPTIDSVQPEVFRAVLSGYVAGGGALPPPGEHWFMDHLSGWTWFVRWNVERCLEGSEPTSGPSLAVAHRVVEDGVNGLRASLDHLGALAALVVP